MWDDYNIIVLLLLFTKINTIIIETIVLISGQVGFVSPKEPGNLMGTAGVIRTILLVDIAAMALFALIYLRQRRMHWTTLCCWGLLAICIPVLGPFLVISNRPGEWDPDFSIARDIRQLESWLQRLLPTTPHRKLGTLDRARLRRQKKKK